MLTFLGNCITSIAKNDVCQLKSTALGCLSDTLTARNCLCEEGFVGNETKCHLTGRKS